MLEHSQLHHHITSLCAFFFDCAVEPAGAAAAATSVLKHLTSSIFSAATTRGTCTGAAVRTVVGLNVATHVAQWALDSGATSAAQATADAAAGGAADLAPMREAFVGLLPVLRVATSKASAEYYTRLSESGRAVLDILRRLPGVEAFETLGHTLKMERAVAKARVEGTKALRQARLREGRIAGKKGAVVRRGKMEGRRPGVVSAKRDAQPVMKTSSGKRPPIKGKKNPLGKPKFFSGGKSKK